MGFYGLILNKKDSLNILFFFMALSLALWTFSYSIGISAESYEDALFFYRFATLGWAFYYALIVNLTKRISIRDTKKSIGLVYKFFLYTPAVFFIFTLLLLESGKKHYNIIYNQFGWVNVVPDTIISHMVTFYAIISAVLIVVNLYNWYKITDDARAKKVVKLAIFLTIGIGILSIVVDVYFVRILNVNMVQITPISVFPPTFVTFYILLKTRIISQSKTLDINNFFDHESKKRLFNLLGFFYIILAYATLLINYFNAHRYKEYELFFMVFILFIATMHFFLNDIFKREAYQYIFLATISVISMYVLYYIYYDAKAITIWAFFFFFLIISTIFENMYYAYFIITFMVISEIISAFNGTDGHVIVDWTDHIGRIIIILSSSALIFYINYVYRKKSKEIILQVENRNTINKISTYLLEMDNNSIEELAFMNLSLMHKGFDCVRTYFASFDKNEELIELFLVSDESNEVKHDLSGTIFDIDPSWLDELKDGKTVNISNINTLYCNTCSTTKKCFDEMGISGFYAFPIIINGVMRAVQVLEILENEKNKTIFIYENLIKNMLYVTIKRLENESKLFYRANYDDLTGLEKRNYFESNINKVLIDVPIQKYFVLYIDIEDFKMINETFGHAVGDEILKKSADLIKSFTGDNGIYSRLTADEFGLFAPSINSEDDIVELTKNIIKVFKKGISVDNNLFRLNLSIGISKYPNDGASANELVKNAGLAMQESKKLTYSRYHFCDTKDKQFVLETAIYTDRLYKALENDELFLVYQPQISLNEEKIVGVEALIRWKSPDFGIVSPGTFVSILERTGLINEVGDWIIEEAIKQHIRMREKGLKLIKISINLSVAQFLDNSLVSKIRSILDKYDVDTSYFEFEITESIAINDNNFVNETLEQIKKMGFSIAIDDFGTGFSSLNRIHNLPIDKLKIDKSFIDEIGMNSKKEAIVDVIIGLAKSLNLTSIAEGVEDECQIKYLKDISCDEIQGYYYAKPMTASDLEEYIKKMS